MIREIIPGRQKCDRCWHLISSVKVPVALTSAEVIDLAGSID